MEKALSPNQQGTFPPLIAEHDVSEEYAGKRIDQLLALLYPSYSRSRLTQWIKSGAIQLNHSVCKPKEKVSTGDQIQVHVEFSDIKTNISPDTLFEAQPISLDVLYEDEFLLIVNKPAGLVVHPGAGNPRNTLVNALVHYAPQLQHLPRAGIVHRLDKETTGLLIIAKTLETHLALVKQMQEQAIKRQYLALVHGHLIAGGTIQTFYGRHPQNRLKMAVCHSGREAITQYCVRKRYKQFTLLDVNLLTGRTHQIRVHMAYKKHPVVGDPLYGGRSRIPAAASRELQDFLQHFKRQALHAYQLTFDHPMSQEPLCVQAPLPADFSELIHLLDSL